MFSVEFIKDKKHYICLIILILGSLPVIEIYRRIDKKVQNHTVAPEWSEPRQNYIMQREDNYKGYAKTELFVGDRLLRRRILLEEKCKEHENLFLKAKYYNKYMFAIKSVNNLMICQIPKVGTTTWMVHLLYLKGIKNFDHENAHHLKNNIEKGVLAMKHYSKDRIFKIMSNPRGNLKSVVRIVTVRDPLERLISAYNDKFGGGSKIILGKSSPTKNSHWSYHLEIMKSNNISAKKGDTISFTFTQFLWHIYKGPMNQHWMPYYMRCSLCTYHFDFIVHLSTFDEDMTYIYKAAQIQDHIRSNKSYNVVNKSEQSDIHSYFNNQPKYLLYNVFKMYRLDFYLFAFKMPYFLKQFESPSSSNITKRRYLINDQQFNLSATERL